MADELTPTDFPQGELLFYTSKDGKVKMEIRVEDETIWMSQQMMAELFQTTKQNISLHIANITQCDELQETGTVKENLTVRKEGNRQVQRKVVFYNLDWIISVGYRVNSVRGTQFRIWATQQLSELMRKGFVLDKERLKNPPIKGASALPDYFDDLLEQIRDIRASERRMYLRIRDIFALSADYEPGNKQTNNFFSTIQNKLHYAIHGHTAAELIMLRADSTEPNMGLTSWQRERVLSSDVATAKNYLNEQEIESFNRLTSMCLDFVEDQAKQRRQVFMKDWEKAIDGLLTLTGRNVLQGKGSRSISEAREYAQEQYRLFSIRRREAAEHTAEIELQNALVAEVAQLTKEKRK
ncbi:MAG: virulence RhuM family protein [Bacteroidaceae bacterium]|nr:virulence RhuM family protein [Bacteroidaceae bacterium]